MTEEWTSKSVAELMREITPLLHSIGITFTDFINSLIPMLYNLYQSLPQEAREVIDNLVVVEEEAEVEEKVEERFVVENAHLDKTRENAKNN